MSVPSPVIEINESISMMSLLDSRNSDLVIIRCFNSIRQKLADELTRFEGLIQMKESETRHTLDMKLRVVILTPEEFEKIVEHAHEMGKK